MPSSIAEASARPDAAKPASLKLPSRHRAQRWRKFLSYYRPHLGLLIADLACVVLVSASALALPLLETIVELRIGLLFDVYTPDQSEALQDQHEVAKQE